MASPLLLKLHLDSTHTPAFLDLVGTVPYDIVLQVRRGTSDLTRYMNILTDDSLFDIPHAFSSGLLKLIDLGSKEQVDLGFVGTSPKPTASRRIITPHRGLHLYVCSSTTLLSLCDSVLI